ncbi:nicotinate-nucleotide adenylyltransferase [Geomonas sp. RF6]|uniref:nicotinate-nucleotide adenylyltransferase n=1 Tax=Geomonas sp. RF6 TaxID=2897342 RepID=UPI001E4075F3|nr:nicotinate-nucleotide adenylyltransferase [Geomonas sp. RF6]UFS72387.1 nicotinate-nucleotide adenylyltransferase [Geomonas sp. RF6]
MRVGILGGTFNPIHMAHLRIAEESRDRLGLDRIMFIPAATPPHKPQIGELSYADRFEMVRLAIQDNPHFTASAMEQERGGRSYSIDTLRQLRQDFPDDEFFFIIGGDSFAEIATWYRYSEIFACCNIVAVQRPGSTFESLATGLPTAIADQFTHVDTPDTLTHASGFRLLAVDGVLLDISSSQIRSLVKSGRSIRYLVPEAVERYIQEQRLYIDVR